jgi:hypothetical protein
MNLSTLFDALPTVDVQTEDFTAEPVTEFLNFRIGRNSDGYPCLIVSTLEMSQGPPLDIDGQKLSVGFRRSCSVRFEDNVSSEVLTIATCKSSDPTLQSYFFSVCESLITALGSNPNETAVEHSFMALLELFKSVTQPPIKTIRGLWAELYFISTADDPTEAVKAWHSTPNDTYDFNDGVERVEVKSTGQHQRVHEFSQAQLNPPDGISVVIASMFVERSGSGLSLQSILENIRTVLSGDAEILMQFESSAAKSLGNLMTTTLDIGFDQGLASNTLQFFDSQDVPKIDRVNVPTDISSLRYSSDLSSCEALDTDDINLRGALVRNMCLKFS